MEHGTFGRYRLLEKIGEGGMGRVFRAHDPAMDRHVAVKLLRKDFAADPEYRERFRREALKAAGLTSPNIIPIHDFGDANGQLYIVMPFIDGSTLDDVLRGTGPMHPGRAVHIVEQLAGALTVSHARNLVHRDVKPSNALITSNDFAYLIDFGIAHDASATKLTRTGGVVGSMAYMAPERFTLGTADVRADVYSLTCVLHECLTGAQPFPGTSMEQQIAAHLTAEPPRPSRSRHGVPGHLDDVIARGMAKNPDERYQSTRDFAIAARDALSGPRVPAGRPALEGPGVAPLVDPSVAATAPADHGVLPTRAISAGESSTPPAARVDTPSVPAAAGVPAAVGVLLVAVGVIGAVPNAAAWVTDYSMPLGYWWLAVCAWIALGVAMLGLSRWGGGGRRPAVRSLAIAVASAAMLLAILETVLDFGPEWNWLDGADAYRRWMIVFGVVIAILGILMAALGAASLRDHPRGFGVALIAAVLPALVSAGGALAWASWFWVPYVVMLLVVAVAGALALKRRPAQSRPHD